LTSETPSDLFFTPSVKAVQSSRGSRDNYARMAAAGAFRTEVTPDVAAFLAKRDSVYFATANVCGQPDGWHHRQSAGGNHRKRWSARVRHGREDQGRRPIVTNT
jgi:hypothetical protein